VIKKAFIVMAIVSVQSCTHQMKNSDSDQNFTTNNKAEASLQDRSVSSLNEEDIIFVNIPGNGKIQDFEMAQYEVTQYQWVNLMGTNPSTFKKPENCSGDYLKKGEIEMCARHPVDTITIGETKAFTDKLNERNDGYHYSLPSNQQWEYAARAGRTTKYTYGDEKDERTNSDYAVVYAEPSQTAPVGTKKPNAFGLYDIHGNVWEFTSYFNGIHRWLRGGSYYTDPKHFRPDYYYNFRANARREAFGFRVIRVKKSSI
jgi:formylglycine-generating enzyme required for sulfatase activity